jgi:hypothetical protein
MYKQLCNNFFIILTKNANPIVSWSNIRLRNLGVPNMQDKDEWYNNPLEVSHTFLENVTTIEGGENCMRYGC